MFTLQSFCWGSWYYYNCFLLRLQDKFQKNTSNEIEECENKRKSLVFCSAKKKKAKEIFKILLQCIIFCFIIYNDRICPQCRAEHITGGIKQ
jgi:hypothetical protein